MSSTPPMGEVEKSEPGAQQLASLPHTTGHTALCFTSLSAGMESAKFFTAEVITAIHVFLYLINCIEV